MRPRVLGRAGAAVAVAGALLGLLALTACSGSDDDDPYAVPERFRAYCDEVEALRAPIGDALSSGGDATGLIKALPSFRTLADKAPDDIAPEWEVVVGRIEDLVAALDAAGVDPDAYRRNHPPKGLTQAQRDTIDAAALALASSATAQAMSSVQQQARDVCKTPLTL